MKKHKNTPIILDKKTVYIAKDVVFGENVIIYPNNFIDSGTVIGNNVTILCGNHISSSKIGDGCKVHYSYIDKSSIGNRTIVLPFCTIKDGTKIGANCKIYSYCYLTKEKLEDNTKIYASVFTNNITN